MRKTFILGLGAQKAGTTWLHDYLSGFAEADFGFTKEYHVLDAVHLSIGRPFHADRVARAQTLLGEGRRFAANPMLWRQIAFEADLDQYYAYFHWLLAREGVTLTGDISPAYCGLSAEVLGEVRRAFAARGVRVVALFLMRDPVERCWSAVRMYRRRAREADPGVAFPETEEAAVAAYAASEIGRVRTRYDRTLAAIEAAFPAEDTILGLYETLFTEGEIARICGALGLAPRPAETGQRLNASAKTAPLSAATRAAIARAYAPVYSAAAARVGAEAIARHWPSAARTAEGAIT